MVIIFSAIARTSFALVTVVSILPFSKRYVTMPLSIDLRWSLALPSFLAPGIKSHSFTVSVFFD